MDLRQISHFLQIWAFPPGLILLLVLMGFLIAKYYSKRVGQTIIIASFILFWVLSTPLFTQQLINHLQNQYQPLMDTQFALQTDPEHSVIIVLGSGVENALEYHNKHTLTDKSLSRLLYTVYLYHKTHYPIVVSGGNKDKMASTEAELMGDILKNLYQVPVRMMEKESRNTRDEAKLLAPMLKAAGINHILIVTHAWHMPRTMLAFHKAFADADAHITITAAPMGYILLSSQGGISNYLPLLTALNASVTALHEYVGMIWYRLFYKM